jgi:hypothetical protein
MTDPVHLVSEYSTVELSELLSSPLVKGLLQFSRCELLLLEGGSQGTGIDWEPRIRETPTIEAVTR